ncbi:hypothetical protein [Dyadobacter sp. CY323]|uniref:hypothetical protein n=1 Tax=Dyadobacter sp. CY323 TaxID=2907302 RepID=UPI001F1755DE|nr:hypothetical protein [Dyadobacter sp. CY323]MCE6988173.1 hypothetical protein [Dyadobacter sp. CY323]
MKPNRIACLLLLLLLSEMSFSQAISFSYDLAGNRIKRNSACDLTPTLDINGLQFAPAVQRDFVVNIYEISNQETTGSINLRITKLPAFVITYPLTNSISNVFGGKQNQNSDWTFSENANFIFASSKAGTKIQANGKAVIGFNVSRKNGSASGISQNISVAVIANSGGEANPLNNQVVTSILTN